MSIADLDRVIESLESALDYIDRRLEKAEAREALTLLRRMREGAVEVGINGEMGPIGFDKPDCYILARTFGKDGDVPALLITTPEDS